MNQFYTKAICTTLFLYISITVAAQDKVLNKYGLWVINDIAVYKKSIRNKPELALAAIKK